VFPESLSGTPLDPRGNHKRREKICTRLEELVDSYAEDRRADTVADVAEKLKRALAANTIGGSVTQKKSWRTALQEADRLKASWDRLGPIIDARDRDLFGRFQDAYANLSRFRHQQKADDRPSKEAAS
jgi:hypothetical protein